MTTVQRAICYPLGAIAVLLGIFDLDTRVGIIAVGLVLLGVVSVDQLVALTRRPRDPWPREPGDEQP